MLNVMLKLCVNAVLLLGVPSIRQRVSMFITGRLTSVLGDGVSVKQVGVKLLGHVVVSSLLLSSRSNGRVLGIAHLSTGFSVLPLFDNGVSVDGVRLFNFGVGLDGRAPGSGPGFRFMLSTFTSGSAIRGGGGLSLHVGSLLVHHKGISCSILSRGRAPKGFGPRRLHLHGVVTGVSLGTLRGSSVGTTVGHLDVRRRRSKFRLGGLDLGIVNGSRQVGVRGFTVSLPGASLTVSAVRVSCSDLKTFSGLTRSIHFSFRLLPSRVTLRSLSTFIPTFNSFGRGLRMRMRASNAIGRLGYPRLSISIKGRFCLEKSMSLRSLSRPRGTCVFNGLSGLCTSPRKVTFFIQGFDGGCGKMPPILRRLKAISFHKRMSNCFASLMACKRMHASVKAVRASMGLDSGGSGNCFTCSNTIGAGRFRLNGVLNGGGLNGMAFGLSIGDDRCRGRCPSMLLGKLITSVSCDSCGCRGVALSKRCGRKNFAKGITLSSAGNSIVLGNAVGATDQMPAFGFRTDVSGFHPRTLRLAPSCRSARVSIGIGTSFANNSVSRVGNRVGVSDLSFTTPRARCFLSGLGVSTVERDRGRGQLAVRSGFLRNDVRNSCSCHALPTDMLGVVHHCVPTLVLPSGGPVRARGGFRFSVRVCGARLLSAIFRVPMGMCARSAVGKCFGSGTRQLHMRNCFPHLHCRGGFVRSKVFLYRGPNSRFRAHLHFDGHGSDNTIGVTLRTRTRDGDVRAALG